MRLNNNLYSILKVALVATIILLLSPQICLAQLSDKDANDNILSPFKMQEISGSLGFLQSDTIFINREIPRIYECKLCRYYDTLGNIPLLKYRTCLNPIEDKDNREVVVRRMYIIAYDDDQCLFVQNTKPYHTYEFMSTNWKNLLALGQNSEISDKILITEDEKNIYYGVGENISQNSVDVKFINAEDFQKNYTLTLKRISPDSFFLSKINYVFNYGTIQSVEASGLSLDSNMLDKDIKLIFVDKTKYYINNRGLTFDFGKDEVVMPSNVFYRNAIKNEVLELRYPSGISTFDSLYTLAKKSEATETSYHKQSRNLLMKHPKATSLSAKDLEYFTNRSKVLAMYQNAVEGNNYRQKNKQVEQPGYIQRIENKRIEYFEGVVQPERLKLNQLRKVFHAYDNLIHTFPNRDSIYNDAALKNLNEWLSENKTLLISLNESVYNSISMEVSSLSNNSIKQAPVFTNLNSILTKIETSFELNIRAQAYKEGLYSIYKNYLETLNILNDDSAKSIGNKISNCLKDNFDLNAMRDQFNFSSLYNFTYYRCIEEEALYLNSKTSTPDTKDIYYLVDYINNLNSNSINKLLDTIDRYDSMDSKKYADTTNKIKRKSFIKQLQTINLLRNFFNGHSYGLKFKGDCPPFKNTQKFINNGESGPSIILRNFIYNHDSCFMKKLDKNYILSLQDFISKPIKYINKYELSNINQYMDAMDSKIKTYIKNSQIYRTAGGDKLDSIDGSMSIDDKKFKKNRAKLGDEPIPFSVLKLWVSSGAGVYLMDKFSPKYIYDVSIKADYHFIGKKEPKVSKVEGYKNFFYEDVFLDFISIEIGKRGFWGKINPDQLEKNMLYDHDYFVRMGVGVKTYKKFIEMENIGFIRKKEAICSSIQTFDFGFTLTRYKEPRVEGLKWAYGPYLGFRIAPYSDRFNVWTRFSAFIMDSPQRTNVFAVPELGVNLSISDLKKSK
jgi:hypothetical protein